MNRFEVIVLILLSFLSLTGCGGGGGGVGGTGGPMPEPQESCATFEVPTEDGCTSSVMLSSPLTATIAVADLRDDEFNRNYGMGMIKAEYAHARGYLGEGVTVAVLDAEILATHEDLTENVVRGNHEVTITTGGSHGTNVAGVIAASRNGKGLVGVAPESKIVSFIDGLLTASVGFSLALESGAKVMNNSWGVAAFIFMTNRVMGNTVIIDLPLYYDEWKDIPVLLPEMGEEVGLGIPRAKEEHGTYREYADSLAAEVRRQRDSVIVWGGGNHGWHPEGSVDRVIGLECPLNDLMCERNTSPKLKISELLNGDYGLLMTLSLSMNDIVTLTALSSLNLEEYPSVGIDLLGELPGHEGYGDLEESWLAVFATDRMGQTLSSFSNSCGPVAKWWCLGAPGVDITTTGHRQITSYVSQGGTSFSAPYVSGALAVLKSRLPEMPMKVIRAVLLHTATPMSDGAMTTRVDDVYGWGLLNLQSAVEFQGAINIATVSQRSAQPSPSLLETKINLPSGFADVRGRLSNISLAVSVMGNAHYNTGLNNMAEVLEVPKLDLTDVGREMLYAPSRRYESGVLFAALDTANHDFRYVGAEWDWDSLGKWRAQQSLCDDCEGAWWEEWNTDETPLPVAPMFAMNDDDRYVLEHVGKNIRPFFARGDGDSPYYQYGLKLQHEVQGWNFALEGSHIVEEQNFMGANFGSLGRTNTDSRQLKVHVGGDLGFGIRGHAGVETAHADVEVQNDGFLQSVSGLRMHGWTTGLEKRDLFMGEDILRLSFRRMPSVSNGRAEFRYKRAVCNDGSSGDCFTETFYSHIPGAPSRSREQVLILETETVDLTSRGESLITLGYVFTAGEGSRLGLGLAKEMERNRAGISAHLQMNL